MATSAREGDRSCSDVVTVGNGESTATGLGAQEEEEEKVMRMVAEEEGGGGEEEQQEEPEDEGAEERGGVYREEQAEEVQQCSICLDAVVVGGGERSIARLQCGHEFHLDCIGSAFNSKGTMQCPNCRQIERGHWLYAKGPVSSQYVNNDDWLFDEDPYDFSDPEVFVPLHFQWCPFDHMSELSSFSDEIELSQAAAFQDVMGQNFNAEPIAISEPGTSQQGAYAAYLQSLPPSSSIHIIERTVDGSAYHEHWNPLAGPSDVHPMHGVHPIDFHHHHVWVPMPQSFFPPSNNNGVAEQPGIPVGATRIGGVDSGSQQQGSLPSFYGNGSEGPIIPSVPLMAPQLVSAPGNINEQFQQGSSSLLAGSQRYGGMRPLGAGGHAMPPPDVTSYLFPEGSSGSSFVETSEDVGGNRFYVLDWAHFGSHSPVNNEGVRLSSSQQEPPQGAQQPASAPRRLLGHWVGSASPPSPPENSSPDNAPFQQMHHHRM